jgi:hypothetical protein
MPSLNMPGGIYPDSKFSLQNPAPRLSLTSDEKLHRSKYAENLTCVDVDGGNRTRGACGVYEWATRPNHRRRTASKQCRTVGFCSIAELANLNASANTESIDTAKQ